MVGTGLSLVRGRYLSLVRGRREKTQYYGWHPSLMMGRMRESPWYGWHLCLVRGRQRKPMVWLVPVSSKGTTEKAHGKSTVPISSNGGGERKPHDMVGTCV